MNADHQEVYAELCEMRLTPPGVALSFEARLARENGWDLAQAVVVVNEYRKFLFLMLHAGHPVTPSDQVDQAWHLHLIYTDSYWNNLCGRIAGRPLHHGPTAGGGNEQEKFTDWYARTKDSYRRFFGQEPPTDVWPNAETRFGEDVLFQRVNIARNLVLPRPAYLLRQCMSKIRTLFVGKAGLDRDMNPSPTTAPASTLAIAPLCLAQMNPFNFNAHDFLIFYSMTIAMGVVAAIVLRIVLRDRETLDSVALEKTTKQLSVEEIAFLSHGPKGPVDAAIAQLSHDGSLKANVTNRRLSSLFETSIKAPLLHQTILSATCSGDGKAILEIRKACASAVLKTATELKDRGLVESFSSFMLPRFSSVLVMFAVLVLGLCRIWIGLERNKPVGYLVLLTILVFIIGCILFYRPRLTAKGTQILEHLRQRHMKSDSLRAKKGSDDHVTAFQDIGMSVALFGVAAMGGQLLDPIIANILIHDKTRVSGDGGVYTGGCGGGGGDGGGCGGGGCGGCGGCGG